MLGTLTLLKGKVKDKTTLISLQIKKETKVYKIVKFPHYLLRSIY